MRAVEEPPMETIHLYVVKEKEKQSFTFLPLFGAFLCVVALVGVTVYSGYHPSYEHERLTIPAQFLPLQYFSVAEKIIPTGSKTYPATFAHGILTLTNGSVLSETLPQGIIFTSSSGIEVVTESAVFIPAGSAIGYGVAIVEAKSMSAGKMGNIKAFSMNAVYGTSLYVRNFDNFTGGKDPHTLTFITAQDRQIALANARLSLTTQKANTQAILAKPCSELVTGVVKIVVKWTCQFVAYPKVSGLKITAVRLVGKNFFVDVLFIAHPKKIWVK